MTEQDKQILLQDLCARLPYGVKVTNGIYTITLKVRIDTAPATLAQFVNSDDLKYYLRPMSSMTEEEEIGYDATFDTIYVNGHYDSVMTYKSFDWLNAHHFDYRGLIEKGLALPAPEGMYETKSE